METYCEYHGFRDLCAHFTRHFARQAKSRAKNMKQERKSFSIGGCKDLHPYRRDAEDKLAACFGLPDRKGMNKRRIYEFLWTELHNAPMPLVRRAIAVLRGER